MPGGVDRDRRGRRRRPRSGGRRSGSSRSRRAWRAGRRGPCQARPSRAGSPCSRASRSGSALARMPRAIPPPCRHRHGSPCSSLLGVPSCVFPTRLPDGRPDGTGVPSRWYRVSATVSGRPRRSRTGGGTIWSRRREDRVRVRPALVGQHGDRRSPRRAASGRPPEPEAASGVAEGRRPSTMTDWTPSP